MTDLPWFETPWRRLMQARGQNRLGHSLLLSGPAGIGKRRFARRLAASFLCQSPGDEGRPCGECKGCALFASGGHPDFMRIEPEEPGKAIRVDAIRELIEVLALATNYGGLRVAIVDPADAMNQYAANSLLKTLEEPPPQNLIILITERPTLLPATIRSRCQLVKLARPTEFEALGWLEQQLGPEQKGVISWRALLALADGAPLAAQTLWETEGYKAVQQAFSDLAQLSEGHVSPVNLAQQWLKQSSGEPIHWLYQWLNDVARLTSGLRAPRLQQLGAGALQATLGSVHLPGVYRLNDKVMQALRAERGNLNQQLQLESLLMEWMELLSTKPSTRS